MTCERRRHRYEVMGTVFSFILSASVTQPAVRAVEAELDRIDRLFSTYRPGSQIARLNAGRIRLGDCCPDVREVLRLCSDAECRTSGWFTAEYGTGIDPTGIVKGGRSAARRSCWWEQARRAMRSTGRAVRSDQI